MFIKINNKSSISYVLTSSIIRLNFSNSDEGKVFCDIITSEMVSGTTHNYDSKSTQTTSCSKSIRVFQETNHEAYSQLQKLVGLLKPESSKAYTSSHAIQTESDYSFEK